MIFLSCGRIDCQDVDLFSTFAPDVCHSEAVQDFLKILLNDMNLRLHALSSTCYGNKDTTAGRMDIFFHRKNIVFDRLLQLSSFSLPHSI
jgi:hypothetical protein